MWKQSMFSLDVSVGYYFFIFSTKCQTCRVQGYCRGLPFPFSISPLATRRGQPRFFRKWDLNQHRTVSLLSDWMLHSCIVQRDAFSSPHNIMLSMCWVAPV